MKKKLFCALAMVACITLALALGVGASDWFGEVEIIDNDNDGVSDILVTDKVPYAVTEGDVKSEDALVKLSCDCAKGEHTFPTYYITYINAHVKGELFGFQYDSLNALKGAYCGGTTEYTLSDVIAVEFPAGYKTVDASCLKKAPSIKYVSFAKLSTATTVDDAYGGNNWLDGTGVEEIDIGPYLTKVPSFLCYNCDKLTSVTIPDQITSVGSYAFYSCESLVDLYISENSAITTFGSQSFKNCTSLTAFYIPKGVKTFGFSGSGNSPIDGCKSLYFISDPSNREKESVYYFPTTLTTITGEAFKACAGLNDVLVFHSGITAVSDGWAFCNAKTTAIVFLGDMTNVSTSGNSWNTKGITLYFCNENDKSVDDISTKTSVAKVFCHAEGNEKHIAEKEMATEASCEYPKMVASYCFCGSIVGTPETEGVALGHNYNGDVTYEFTSLTDGGTKYTTCLNGCAKLQNEALPPVYVELGYSVKTYGTDGYSFTSGYEVNTEMLQLYKSIKGVELQFGMAFNSAQDFTKDENVTLDSFKIVAPVASENGGVMFNFHTYIITYGDEASLDKDIIVAAYVKEGDELVFLNRGNGEINGFDPVSYNKAHELSK